jgi:hypothetical protein
MYIKHNAKVESFLNTRKLHEISVISEIQISHFAICGYLNVRQRTNKRSLSNIYTVGFRRGRGHKHRRAVILERKTEARLRFKRRDYYGRV